MQPCWAQNTFFYKKNCYWPQTFEYAEKIADFQKKIFSRSKWTLKTMVFKTFLHEQ